MNKKQSFSVIVLILFVMHSLIPSAFALPLDETGKPAQPEISIDEMGGNEISDDEMSDPGSEDILPGDDSLANPNPLQGLPEESLRHREFRLKTNLKSQQRGRDVVMKRYSEEYFQKKIAPIQRRIDILTQRIENAQKTGGTVKFIQRLADSLANAQADMEKQTKKNEAIRAFRDNKVKVIDDRMSQIYEQLRNLYALLETGDGKPTLSDAERALIIESIKKIEEEVESFNQWFGSKGMAWNFSARSDASQSFVPQFDVWDRFFQRITDTIDSLRQFVVSTDANQRGNLWSQITKNLNLQTSQAAGPSLSVIKIASALRLGPVNTSAALFALRQDLGAVPVEPSTASTAVQLLAQPFEFTLVVEQSLVETYQILFESLRMVPLLSWLIQQTLSPQQKQDYYRADSLRMEIFQTVRQAKEQGRRVKITRDGREEDLEVALLIFRNPISAATPLGTYHLTIEPSAVDVSPAAGSATHVVG